MILNTTPIFLDKKSQKEKITVERSLIIKVPNGPNGVEYLSENKKYSRRN